MRALRNWNGKIHYSLDGETAACGQLATHRSWFAPTDQAVTCQRCLARHGVLAVEPLSPVAETEIERRARERAARRVNRSVV